MGNIYFPMPHYVKKPRMVKYYGINLPIFLNNKKITVIFAVN